MRIRYQQLLGLFERRHCLFVGHRREIVQELSERMPAFEVVDQVLQGLKDAAYRDGPADKDGVRCVEYILTAVRLGK